MQKLALSLLVVCLLVGCDEPPPSTDSSSGTSSGSSSSAPPPPPSAEEIAGVYEESEPIDENETEDGFQREVAKVGVGKKGRNYGGGIISEPIRQRFRVEQQLQLNNVTRAVRMYRAEHGYFPKTKDEFMEKIIKANSIQLPELPDGERYGYEPSTGELMVERPKP